MNTSYQSAWQLMSSIGLTVIPPDTAKHSHFNRSKLPSSKSFWASIGFNFKSQKGWVMVKCLFHEDHHASLGIIAETGGFFCHACGAKGGDVLSAYQLIAGCDFKTAAKALGAWEEL